MLYFVFGNGEVNWKINNQPVCERDMASYKINDQPVCGWVTASMLMLWGSKCVTFK